MGFKCSPDIVQEIMENLLSGIEDEGVNIENAGAFSKDWTHHINLLSILCRLQKNGFGLVIGKLHMG
jgi:hypothetical protein